MIEEWFEAPVLEGTKMRVFDRVLSMDELLTVHELNVLDSEIDQVVMGAPRG